MKPNRPGVAVDSTVQGEAVKMVIDQSALVHLMNVMTDLYEDAPLAAIREYITNAFDSHILAGQTRPIEVCTPTDLRPLLTIRDYGVGLDAQDIREVYSQYGKSTKRETNDAVGMLGLGCKSALAYVDQFTLAGIKGGKRILVSIARDEAGAGTMTVLDTDDDSDEPDGVEICIPTDEAYSLERKARDFLSYWEPGLVVLNGAPVEPLPGYSVGDTYLVAERDTTYSAPGKFDGKPLTIVMGNVAYPPPSGYESEIVKSLPRDKRLVVTMPIGSVQFTPSREGLQDSPQTRAALDAALVDFEPQVGEAVTEAIVGAPNRPAAARALIEARAAFGKKSIPELKWNNEEIPTVLSAEDLEPMPPRTPTGQPYGASLWAARIVNTYSGARGSRTRAGQINLDDAGKNPWVLGYDNDKWSATQRSKLDRFIAYHELHAEPHKATYFITNAGAVPRPEWIDGAVVAVNWKDVRAWKDPDAPPRANGGGSTKYAGTYPTFAPRGYYPKFGADELPKSGRNLYYVPFGNEYLAQMTQRLLSDDAYVVCLTSVREAKFLRLFPHARLAVPAVTRGAMGWYKSLSDDSRLAIKLGPQLRYSVGPIALPADRVDDPELSRLCRVFKLWETGTLRARYEAREFFITIPEDEKTLDHEAICARYPLIDGNSAGTMQSQSAHALIYVNAVYAANEGSK